MNGRQEKTLKIENRVKIRLETMPDVVGDFYYNMKGKTASTKEVYIGHIANLLDYFGDNYVNVTIADLDRYMDSCRYRTDSNGKQIENGVSYIRSRMFAIKKFYDYLVARSIIQENPCNNLEMPKLKTDIAVVSMTPREVATMKDNIKKQRTNPTWRSRDTAILSLGVSTGLRVGAITEINMEDIDFNDHSITVIEKGDVKRTVYFGDNTWYDLKTWVKHRRDLGLTDGPFFVTKYLKRMSTESVRQIIKKYSVGINKHITPHKMRSTCATNLYEQTHDIYMVQAVLGHKNIDNTRRYANISTEERRKAAGILDNI